MTKNSQDNKYRDTSGILVALHTCSLNFGVGEASPQKMYVAVLVAWERNAQLGLELLLGLSGGGCVVGGARARSLSQEADAEQQGGGRGVAGGWCKVGGK